MNYSNSDISDSFKFPSTKNEIIKPDYTYIIEYR